MSYVEERAMSDSRLFGDAAGVAGPSVQVGVEVDHGDGTVYFVEGAEDGEDDGVVAAEAGCVRG